MEQALVAAREYDGAHSATLFLRPLDGSPFRIHRPGQYTSVRIRFADKSEQIRQYTVTHGRQSGEWALSVKRVPDGLVSPILVDRVEEGDQLTVSQPFGGVVVDNGTHPLLLVSAGIGVTNTMATLQYLATYNPAREVTIVHVEASAYEHVRRIEFSALVKSLPHAQLFLRYKDFDGEHDDGRNPLTRVPLPSDAQTYVCGPVDFMRSIRRELIGAGLSPASIHFEAFAPVRGSASRVRRRPFLNEVANPTLQSEWKRLTLGEWPRPTSAPACASYGPSVDSAKPHSPRHSRSPQATSTRSNTTSGP